MNYNSVDILLVEDNPDDAELAIRELSKHGVGNNIFLAHDGEEALEFIFCTGKFTGDRNITYPPKMVLLDINMPKVNGMEVLEKIKADNRTKRIPVVILTSSNQDPDIKKCYDLGANSYIVKPVNFKRFTEAIQNMGLYWLKTNHPPN